MSFSAGSEETSTGAVDETETGDGGTTAGTERTTETSTQETASSDEDQNGAEGNSGTSDEVGTGGSEAGGADGTDEQGLIDADQQRGRLPEVDEVPDWVTASLGDVKVNKTELRVSDVGNLSFSWTIDGPAQDTCERITAAAQGRGLGIEREECAAEGDSTLSDGDVDFSYLSLPQSDGGLLKVTVPSPYSVSEVFAENQVKNLTLPPLSPKWFTRDATPDKVELDFVFEDDGDYLTHCEATVEEIVSYGFSANGPCEQGSITTLEDGGPYTLKVSSTDSGTVFYSFSIERASFNELTRNS